MPDVTPLENFPYFRPLKNALKDQKSFLEKSISSEISNLFLDFVQKSLGYKKGPDIKDLEVSYVEESFMVTNCEFREKERHLHEREH